MEDVAVLKARRIVDQVGGVGGLALNLLRAGRTNEEVHAEVLRTFPEADTSMGSIRWYRRKLILAGEDIPSSVQARRGQWRPRVLSLAA